MTKPHSPIGYALLAPLALISVLAIAGTIYQAGAYAEGRRLHPPPGRMVDVGDYRLHIYCTGSGAPAVILDQRFHNFTNWNRVQPGVATFTQVCSYDRPWYGWSDAGFDEKLDSEQVAKDLHLLLQNAGIPPRYVLVEEGEAQFDGRVYHRRYPGEVAGVVLADGAPPRESARTLQIKAWLAPFGVARLLGWCKPEPPMEEAMDCRDAHFAGMYLDAQSLDQSAQEARSAGTFGDAPLVVVSREQNESQKELLRLSTHSSQMIAPDSGPRISYDRPDVMVAAIRKVLSEATSR